MTVQQGFDVLFPVFILGCVGSDFKAAVGRKAFGAGPDQKSVQPGLHQTPRDFDEEKFLHSRNRAD